MRSPHRLLSELLPQDVVISFNYDLIVERAMKCIALMAVRIGFP
jgi:hypothetical protein